MFYLIFFVLGVARLMAFGSLVIRSFWLLARIAQQPNTNMVTTIMNAKNIRYTVRQSCKVPWQWLQGILQIVQFAVPHPLAFMASGVGVGTGVVSGEGVPDGAGAGTEDELGNISTITKHRQEGPLTLKGWRGNVVIFSVTVLAIIKRQAFSSFAVPYIVFAAAVLIPITQAVICWVSN